MVNKAKNHDTKFLDILTFDIVKQLIDRYGHGEGWIELLKVKPKVAKKDDSKKSHYCHFCNNGFCNIKNLKVHIEKYHQISVNYSCERCEFNSVIKEEFEKHIEKSHIDPISTYECNVCDYTFTNENEFKKHTEKHRTTTQSVSRIDCDMSDLTSMQENEMEKHLEKGHRDQSFRCDKCENRFDSDEDMKKHEDETHGDEEMEIENTVEIKEGNKRGRKLSPPNSNPSYPTNKKHETDKGQKDI